MLYFQASAGTIKSLLIFFAPIILPWVIRSYRTARTSLAQRPATRPIPSEAARALNILFVVIILFLLLSLPFNPHAPTTSIFAQTGSRLSTPTEIIFSRLARRRPLNELTEGDTLLRSKLTSTAARNIYLRYGPDGLISCPFCTSEDVTSYLFYYLPFNMVIPHVFHFLILGLVTSAPLVGKVAGRWRNTFTLMGLILAAIDIYVMVTYDPVKSASPAVRANQVPPLSLYYAMGLFRPLAFMIFDSICALLIYVSATNRFFFTPPTPSEQVEGPVMSAIMTLTGASSKLVTLSVIRSAVLRDKTLKTRDDAYWSTVSAIEKQGNSQAGGPSSIWEEEEVVRAISRAMNDPSSVDMARLGVGAGEYVDKVTAGLEDAGERQLG